MQRAAAERGRGRGTGRQSSTHAGLCVMGGGQLPSVPLHPLVSTTPAPTAFLPSVLGNKQGSLTAA